MQLCIDYLFIYFVGMIINKNYVITTGAPLNHPPTTVHGQYSALHAVDRLRLLRLPPGFNCRVGTRNTHLKFIITFLVFPF